MVWRVSSRIDLELERFRVNFRSMMCEYLIISLTSNVSLGTYITKKREERELVLVQEIKLDGHSNTKDKNTAREKQAEETRKEVCVCVYIVCNSIHKEEPSPSTNGKSC